jgi:hypothetical protein
MPVVLFEGTFLDVLEEISELPDIESKGKYLLFLPMSPDDMSGEMPAAILYIEHEEQSPVFEIFSKDGVLLKDYTDSEGGGWFDKQQIPTDHDFSEDDDWE